MKFDKDWIVDKQPCSAAVEWLGKQRSKAASTLIKKAIKEKRFEWCEWAISRSLTPDQNRLWAIFCAEQVLLIFEKEFPNDDRPRKAIEAAKSNNSEAAWAARAWAAAEAAWAARAWAAAWAAWAAARAEAAAAEAAWAAARAAAEAAWAAARAADDHDLMRAKCIMYGLKLLEGK